MKLSQSGINLLKKYEGFRSTPYLCTSNKPTIGYGSTFYENGTKVTLNDGPIDKERAEKLLLDVLKKFERKVVLRIKVPITQNQFDALVLHTYNSGGSDTLFSLINNKADISVIEDWWTTRYITSGGKKSKGLITRRREEFELFKKDYVK